MSKFTLDWLKSVTKDEFIKDVKGLTMGSDELNEVNALTNTPEGRKIAYEMVNDADYTPYSKRVPDEVEVAQIAADTARADAENAEQQRQISEASAAAVAAFTAAPVDHSVEDAEAQAHGATIVRDAQGKIAKVVVDYQVRGEGGRAIGRATHFEGRTLAEVVGKVIQAHTNAVTYSERVKNNKFKQTTIAYEGSNVAAAAVLAESESERLMAEAMKTQDPEKLKIAIAKASEAKAITANADASARAYGQAVAEAWCYDHRHDFDPTQANIAIMGEYITTNKLIMSHEALDQTLAAVKHKLSPVPQVERVSASVTPSAAPVNNPPAAAAAAAVAPASITQADVEAAVEKALKAQLAAAPQGAPQAAVTGQQPTPATANQPTVARRPGVNGGLQPGSLTAARPSVQTDTQTTAETRSTLLRAIAKMGPEEFRKKLRDANYVKQLDAAGVKYK